MYQIILKIAKKSFIFGSLKRPIIPYYVNLMYFNQKLGKRKQYNVGDYLSLIIFKFLLKKHNIRSLKSNATVRFSFIGSIIQFLTADSLVYGSGIIYEKAGDIIAKKGIDLDIRAVRGPKTKLLLEKIGYKVPAVFGDPAILLPIFYKPLNADKKKDFIVIPHWKNINQYERSNYPILSPLTNNWKNFIDEIASSALVISASLHGIILAEAYGVPAILLGETEHEDLFKYDDYYQSTNRHEYPIAGSIDEALSMEIPPVPNLELLQQKLLENFPIDIFKI